MAGAGFCHDEPVGDRPYTLLSCAVSVDGYLDDAGPERLVLSDAADLDRVDAERAAADAIMVGANTIRRDDPRLLVRSPERRAERRAGGLPADPVKVTVTSSGDLDPQRRFFTTGEGRKIVYATSGGAAALGARLGTPHAGPASDGHDVDIVDLGADADLAVVLADLAGRGVRRLFVEGGGRVLTEFLTRGLADELHLVVAPFFVGDAAAPRFALPGSYPYGPGNPMRPAEVRRIGDLVLLDYLLRTDEPGTGADTEPADRVWLERAVELSRACPPSGTAFSVGAVLVAADGTAIATGYSRETGPRDHAEEVALAKAAGDTRLGGATMYTSLEPCSGRSSRPRSCTDLILEAGVPRVVFAWREPEVFVDCVGAETLREAGRTVLELTDLAPAVREINAHLL